MIPITTHKFVYGAGDPVNRIDPNGREAIIFQGWRAVKSALKAEIFSEVRRELAELENRVILRLNGTYIRRRECELSTANVRQRIDALATEVKRHAG
jgi:hypothetical protein